MHRSACPAQQLVRTRFDNAGEKPDLARTKAANLRPLDFEGEPVAIIANVVLDWRQDSSACLILSCTWVALEARFVIRGSQVQILQPAPMNSVVQPEDMGEDLYLGRR